jgi:hypothetical protein
VKPLATITSVTVQKFF